MCPKCANEEGDKVKNMYYNINYENEDLYCDICSEQIPSAYGED